MGLHEPSTQESGSDNEQIGSSGRGPRSSDDVAQTVNNELIEKDTSAYKDLTSNMANRKDDLGADVIAAVGANKQVMIEKTTPEPDVLLKQDVASSASIENAAAKSGPSPSLEVMQDNDAPVPIGLTDDTGKQPKKNEGIVILDSDAPHPFGACSHDDSLLREKEKMKQHEVSVPHIERSIDNDAASASQRTLEESVSFPYLDEEEQMLPTRSISRQRETSAATGTTTLSEGTIFDAYSQRASEMRCTEDTQIFIPEATIVEESPKEDIPSAEVVIPEKYSITIAGRKVHAGVLVLVGIVFIVLVVALSVTLTRPAPGGGGSSSPTLSRMPSSPPSIQPSAAPTTALYSSLIDTIYGESIHDIDFDEQRKATMEWLADDQASTTVSLSDEQLRERYALALLYFVSNADGSWYDDMKFLSSGHVCTWRMKRSGEKKGVLLCDDEDRVLQLVLYANSLHGTMPEELLFLPELQVLRLDSNRIESSLPSDFGSFSKLSEISLYSNSFTGTIPISFEQLSNLTLLHLSDNLFSGRLFNVDSIPNLKTFRVDGNNFSGDIPVSFGSTFLDTFHINRNRISSSMDFMCNNLPLDYKLDCDGENPEVACTCCVGCTIISEETCVEGQELASITISSGYYDNVFSWQLYQETIDELGWSTQHLLAAGGDYEAGDEIYFQLCLSYPEQYYFYTQSNFTDDSDSSITTSVGGGELFVGPQEVSYFVLTDAGTLEIVTTPPTSAAAVGGFGEASDDFYGYDVEAIYSYSDDMLESISFKTGPCIEFEMNLQTDSFGDETSWDIVNTLDGSVVRSIDGGSYESNTTYFEAECLDVHGCYTFTIFDEWSDGICCEAGEGWFNISVNDRFLYKGGDFKESDTVAIGGSCSSAVPKSGECPQSTNQINVTIQTDAHGGDMSWEVYDKMTGQIYCLNSGIMEENALQITNNCIPDDTCMAFAIYDTAGDGFNETSGGFFKVSYNNEVVATGEGNFGYQDVTFFGYGCNR